MRVLPEGTIDKTFDYLVPDALGDQVRVGTRVRVELHGRRVGAWVVADDVTPPPDVVLRPIVKVTGWGPPPELVELARWAAWRWAGRPASLLTTASPERAVRGLPPARVVTARPTPADGGPASSIAALAAEALAGPGAVVRVPPAADPLAFVIAAAGTGRSLALVPSIAQARRLGQRLRRRGVAVAVMPDDWASARAGAATVVVGTRAAAWAPVPGLAAVVVLDEHDEVYQEERTPTWHARDVGLERARRAGAPAVLVSPMPTLEALAWADGRDAPLLTPGRSVERDGWPAVEIIDRRDEEPGRTGLYSERLVAALRTDGRVVCVLNRKGRARLLACAHCGEATRCERCDAAVSAGDDGSLVCRRCGTARPVICQSCGRIKLKTLQVGVSRAREELEALVREPVVEVTGDGRDGPLPAARVYVGTEAVLHQVPDARVVAFLDLDQELLAPRYRAAEQALGLLVRGARLLARGAAARRDHGDGDEGTDRRRPVGRVALGRLVLQTRLPDHEVVQAALHGDPARVADAERARRQVLRFPPVAALAAVSGVAAAELVAALPPVEALDVLGPADDRWLLRAPDHGVLCDALAATARPAGRVRIEIDPLRI